MGRIYKTERRNGHERRNSERRRVRPGPTEGSRLLYGWLKRANYLGRRSEAADLLGVHFATLAQFLNGDRTPGLAKAVEIAEVSGVPIVSWAARLSAELARDFRATQREDRKRSGRKEMRDANS